MSNEVLSLIIGGIVFAIVGVLIFEAGRKTGVAGILTQLQTLDANKPALNIAEGLVTSIPGDVAERIIGKIIEGYTALRPFITDPQLQAVGDVAEDIGKQLEDHTDAGTTSTTTLTRKVEPAEDPETEAGHLGTLP